MTAVEGQIRWWKRHGFSPAECLGALEIDPWSSTEISPRVWPPTWGDVRAAASMRWEQMQARRWMEAAR